MKCFRSFQASGASRVGSRHRQDGRHHSSAKFAGSSLPGPGLPGRPDLRGSTAPCEMEPACKQQLAWPRPCATPLQGQARRLGVESCRVALARDALTGPHWAAVQVVAAWSRACIGQMLHGLPEGVCRRRMDARSGCSAADRMLLRQCLLTGRPAAASCRQQIPRPILATQSTAEDLICCTGWTCSCVMP